MKNGKKMKTLLQTLCVVGITCLMIVPVSASELSLTRKTTGAPLNGGEPTTIYVDGKNTAGPWDGSLEYPYRYIQDGIYDAEEGDTVFVFNATYYENPVVYETINLIGQDMETTIIDGFTTGSVVQILADCCTLSGFTIKNGGTEAIDAGVMIQAWDNLVTNNIIRGNGNYGVYVATCGNTVYHNNIMQNLHQAFDATGENTWDDGYPCGGNFWGDYTGIDEDEDGIGDTSYPIDEENVDRYPLVHPYGSVTNLNTSEIFLTIKAAIADECTHDGHHIFVKNGQYDEHVCIYKKLFLQGQGAEITWIYGRNSGTVVKIVENDVTLSGFTIKGSGNQTPDAGVKIEAACDTVTGNVIKGNYQGIILTGCADDTAISRNSITLNNWNGVMINQGCTNSFIFENDITDNFFAGVGISQATGNFLFHNNFLRNRHNAYDDGTNIWDDGYPSGGNYWDDYNGIDQMHGVLQNQPGSDGIGDTPCMVPSGINKDRYPLKEPYTGSDTTAPWLKLVSPTNGFYIRDHQRLSKILKHKIIILGRITFTVEAFDLQGVAMVQFYVDDMMTPAAELTQPPYQWTWKQHPLIRHRHTIAVAAIDTAGNLNSIVFEVYKLF